MPLETIKILDRRAWGLWHITEDEERLQQLLKLHDFPPENITKSEKRLEWLAGRVLTQRLLEALGNEYYGIRKDEFGKPFPTSHPFQLSLSHSYPYVAAIIDEAYSVGIDLEQPKEKLLRVAPRVLSSGELKDAADDLVKHCIYWCAKESLIKVFGQKHLTLAENLLIEPFERKAEGRIIGRIIVDSEQTLIPLYYTVFANFVVVFSEPTRQRLIE
jgi:4'-phosphopantetheinyl transferase